MSEDCVKVAVRVRPLITSEIERGCQNCISVVPGEPQIQMNGTEKSFTYNYVFGSDVDQEEVYNSSVKGMIENIFKGYNITILAYGQTGSGKTHSMGTNYSNEAPESTGIIPRAVHDMFETMSSKEHDDWSFRVTVGFMELYNEQLYDLLGDKTRKDCIVDIREDTTGIKVVGLTEREVKSSEDVLNCLVLGSQGRATGATAMNAQSSRSHAIFTITVYQYKKKDSNSATTSKFHLVDLAGSERSKKTQATGDRFKEGVSINKGLLALGNVISNLGDNAAYVGYRDSKLTRLLQDSLGGNSITLMIACVSPADYNFEETLSTLRYADRARKIKNKPIVNQDPKAAEINRLNSLVKDLKLALLEKGPAANCPPEHGDLVEKNRSLQKMIRDLSEKLSANLIDFVGMHERAELAEQSREKLGEGIVGLIEDIQEVMKETDVEIIHSKLKEIHEKLVKLQVHQKQSEAEMIHQISLEKIISKKRESDATAGDDSLTELTLDEEHREHTLLQVERNEEVNKINRELAAKEELVAKLLMNSMHFSEQTKEIQEMENEIKSLQSEKEQLMKTLEDVQANNASAKIAESRRKKMMELEKKISDLTKKCTEQSRILKSKEKSDEQVKNLTQEIQAMKQMRVKLVRDMRKEADKFHQYKILRERELHKLKDQDRKRKNQMERLQVLHNKQQNVMKRKMEEAHAMNKRLKETLELQKKVRASRNEKKKIKDFIQRLVDQEAKVIQETSDAKCLLEGQLRYREKIAEDLKQLKAKFAENPSDRLKREISDLEEYLDLCTTKIAMMQREIVASDQESMTSSRLDGIQTIAEAKQVAQLLFETLEQVHKKRNFELMDTMEKYENLIAEHDLALTRLRQMELAPKISLEEHRKILEEELEKCRKQCLEGQEARSSIEGRRKNSGRKTLASKPSSTITFFAELEKENLETDESFNDDLEKDPDYRGTPIHKRGKSMLKLPQLTEVKTRKRSSESIDGKCHCKTKCQNNYCKCQKNGAICDNECGCNPTRCENRNNDNQTCYFDDDQFAGQVKKLKT